MLQSHAGLAAALTRSAITSKFTNRHIQYLEGSRILLKRVRITASACPNTHFSIVSLPPQTHPLRVWTGNGLDNRRAAGKWNQLDSLAPQPVAAAKATQGTYGQLYPQGLGGWGSKFGIGERTTAPEANANITRVRATGTQVGQVP